MLKLLAYPFKIVFEVLLIAFFTISFTIYWITGVRIKITKNGETVGYLRWFKYYEVKQNWGD